MDLLDDILDTLGMKGALYFRTDFSGRWATTVPDLNNVARFHLVVQGICHVEIDGGSVVDLGPGDLILIPNGRSHVLADAEGREARPLETVLDAVGYDGNGTLIIGDGDSQASTQMVCGHFTFRNGADHPILRALPDYLVFSAAKRTQEPLLDDLLRLVARRMFSYQLGSIASVTRLSEVVFIELLRIGIDSNQDLRAIIGAFTDGQIGQAMELMHQATDQYWTIESLATAVGMSRSRFAHRFSELVGVGPMSYLADWRLQKALSLLEGSRSNIQQVALQTGYQSPAAFSRAFTGKFGFSPREYRRNSQ